jgi:flagellin-like hook-associated protein FlgL
MCKTRSAKVFLVVFLFCVYSIFFTPTSAAQQHVPPVRATAEQDEMININDAIDLVDTTLNGLEEINSILRDLMHMASYSAYGSYSNIQRALMNADFQDYMNEIDLVVESTEYDGFKMLDGLIESIAVRQTRKSFRIKGIDMTQAGLGLDGDNLDISTSQSAKLAMEFLGEAIAIGEQVRCTYIEYFIRLKHLPGPNRRIYRQDDDLLSIDEGMFLIDCALMTLEAIYDNVIDLKVTAVRISQASYTSAHRVIADIYFQESLDRIDSLAERTYSGLNMLNSSTGLMTVRIKGKPLVIEKVDVTLAGLGLDREDLNIRTIQSAEQAIEDLEEARNLLLSTYLTYGGYLNYLETSE